jgi:uncharacterized membrane protein
MWLWMMGGFRGMGFGMFLFWIPIAAIIYLSFIGYFYSRRHRVDRAAVIARERYARGDITLEDFEKIKESLEHN